MAEKMTGWKSAEEKPTSFEVVLLRLIGGEDELDTSNCGDNNLTTGWWSEKANCWMGLSLNQSPPMYPLEDWAVIAWAKIA